MKPGGLTKSIELFEQAIHLAPGYAAAYAGLADTLILAAYWTGLEARAFARARAAAEKALALDQTLAEAYAAMATIHTFHDLDWSAAERMFAKALKLNPNHAFIHFWYSNLLALTRRDDEAVAAARKSHEQDPLSGVINGNYGQILYVTGRAEEAVQLLEEAVALDPNAYFLRHALGWAHREAGNRDLAIQSGRKAVELSGGAAWVETVLALTCYRFGEKEEADRIFAGLRRRAGHEFVWPICFVFLHMARGEMDDAVVWLRKARDEGDPVFCWFNAVRRGSASLNLATDPRIDAILAEAGIP
jgi:tetratricopeptide (TPR) repeat protein